MSEREEETDEEDGYDHRGRSGQNAYAGASGSMSRQHDRERSSSGKRDHSASREMSVSPRSDRRSQTSSAPLKPAKVTLVKSRKNEGKQVKTVREFKGCVFEYLTDITTFFIDLYINGIITYIFITEYGLRLASHIFVKDISPESLAARDGNIREGDVVLKVRKQGGIWWYSYLRFFNLTVKLVES